MGFHIVIYCFNFVELIEKGVAKAFPLKNEESLLIIR